MKMTVVVVVVVDVDVDVSSEVVLVLMMSWLMSWLFVGKVGCWTTWVSFISWKECERFAEGVSGDARERCGSMSSDDGRNKEFTRVGLMIYSYRQSTQGI